MKPKPQYISGHLETGGRLFGVNSRSNQGGNFDQLKSVFNAEERATLARKGGKRAWSNEAEQRAGLPASRKVIHYPGAYSLDLPKPFPLASNFEFPPKPLVESSRWRQERSLQSSWSESCDRRA